MTLWSWSNLLCFFFVSHTVGGWEGSIALWQLATVSIHRTLWAIFDSLRFVTHPQILSFELLKADELTGQTTDCCEPRTHLFFPLPLHFIVSNKNCHKVSVKQVLREISTSIAWLCFGHDQVLKTWLFGHSDRYRGQVYSVFHTVAFPDPMRVTRAKQSQLHNTVSNLHIILGFIQLCLKSAQRNQNLCSHCPLHYLYVHIWLCGGRESSSRRPVTFFSSLHCSVTVLLH